MTENRIIRQSLQLSPLAKAFDDALMSVAFTEHDDEAAITKAIGQALREYYATIECDPRYLAIQIIENI